MNDNRIVRNVVFNLLRGGILFPLELILIPFVLHRIGVAGFGIWALLRVFIGYGNIFDLGISMALEKFTAEHLAGKEYDSLNRLLNISFLAYLAISLFLFLAVVLLREWIVSAFFGEGLKAFGSLPFILLFSAGTFGVSLLFSPFTSLLNGMQRIDLTNTISTASALLNFVGILFVLSLGFGLEGLIVVNGGVVVAAGLGSFLVARRNLPEVRLNPFGPFLNFRQFLKIVFYSLSIQTTRLAGLLHLHLDKFFLSYLIGLQYVTYYEIASRFVERLRFLPQMLIQPIMVAISDLHMRGRQSEIDKIYFQSLRYMILLSLPVFVFSGFFINPIIKLWLGGSYPLTVRALRILIAAHFINLLTGPGFLALMGIGWVRYGVISATAGGILNIVLSYVLIIAIGYNGALLATFLAMVLPSVGFIIAFHRFRRLPLDVAFLAVILKPMVVSFLAAALVFVAVQKFIGEGLYQLIASFFLFLILNGVGTWTILEKGERVKIHSFIHSVRTLARAAYNDYR